jgi:cell division protease FtsH
MTMGQLLDDVCVLFGGREAEQLFFDDVSWGYGNDLSRATDIARALVEDYGLAGETVGMRRVELSSEDPVSEVTKAALDKAIAEILETQRKRARDILTANKPLVTTLRDLLVEKKVLDAAALATLLPSVAKKDPVASER